MGTASFLLGCLGRFPMSPMTSRSSVSLGFVAANTFESVNGFNNIESTNNRTNYKYICGHVFVCVCDDMFYNKRMVLDFTRNSYFFIAKPYNEIGNGMLGLGLDHHFISMLNQ